LAFTTRKPRPATRRSAMARGTEPRMNDAAGGSEMDNPLPELPRPRASYRRVKVSPRRCMWGRARSRREGRRRLAREPAGGKRETEDCGRAKTASNSSWWRCNAAGRSGSLSTPARSLAARAPAASRSSSAAARSRTRPEPVASVLWHTGGAPPLYSCHIQLRQAHWDYLPESLSASSAASSSRCRRRFGS